MRIAKEHAIGFWFLPHNDGHRFFDSQYTPKQYNHACSENRSARCKKEPPNQLWISEHTFSDHQTIEVYIPPSSITHLQRDKYIQKAMKEKNNYARSARLSSLVCALKPVLIADTERVEPQDSHCTKYKRLSLDKIVSGLLQVLQVTYSTDKMIVSASNMCYDSFAPYDPLPI